MACDCIKKIGDKIREKYGNNAYVNTTLMFDGIERFDLTGTYRNKNRKGELEKKERKLHLYATFCPICGKPYDEKKEDTADIVEDNNTEYYIHKFTPEWGTSYKFIRKDGKGIIACDIINGWGFINSVSVRGYYQRQGICGEMLKMVETYFKKNLGISSFYLNCNKDWHVKCYEKYGYTISEDRDGIEENDVKMFKEESDFH